MDLAAELRGISEFMLDVATGEEEDLVHALLDYARRVATRYAYALIESGGRSTSIGEPIAGPAMISPRQYRQYPWAHERRMVTELKEHGIILHLHICGNTERITDDFIATGAQVLEIDHKTDAARLKAAARDSTCLLGNIDTNLLALGSVGEVDAACRELIDICKPGGGLHLGPRMRNGPDHSSGEHPRPRRVGEEIRRLPTLVSTRGLRLQARPRPKLHRSPNPGWLP